MAEQGLSRPVNRGEWRPQLVRGRGDEVGLDLLELAHVGEVAERVDRAPEEANARDRDPALAATRLDRNDDFLVTGIGRVGDRDAVDRVAPTGNRLNRGVAEDGLGVDGRGRLRGGVPEPDDPAPVEEEDAVADVLEHAGGVRAFLDLAVKARAVDREPDPAGEVLDESQVVGAVRRGAIAAGDRDRAEPLAAGLERHRND